MSMPVARLPICVRRRDKVCNRGHAWKCCGGRGDDGRDERSPWLASHDDSAAAIGGGSLCLPSGRAQHWRARMQPGWEVSPCHSWVARLCQDPSIGRWRGRVP
jgi:hypothetical protein